MQSGATTLTDTLPNLFSTKATVSSPTNGFLMVSPFYDTSLPHGTADERNQALRGYTVAMFRGDVFFGSVFRDVDLSHTDLKVYLGDVKPENLQYQTNQATDADRRTVTQKLTEYGKSLTLVYTLDTAEIVPLSINYLPQFLLIGGLIVGAIIAGVSGYLLRSRYRQLVYQNEREVNFAKDELLSLASHQLRTPATGVKQYLGMVLQGFAGDLSDQQRAYLDRAYSSNNRQLHVINDILHLAKLEAGRIVLAERKFDIADMVREVVDEQKSEAKKGEVKLDLKSPPRGMIVGDSHMLRMVAENLVNNAIK
jgi:signal transduction histidine kinase